MSSCVLIPAACILFTGRIRSGNGVVLEKGVGSALISSSEVANKT